MRKFSLVNADGQRWDLTSADNTFFHSVTGLGFERAVIYEQIASRFAIARDDLAQQDIYGVVKFNPKNAIRSYFDFMRFISNKPLALEYNPGNGVHFRRGSVVMVEKSDSADGALRAFITFRCTTPWIRRVIAYNNADTQGGKIYDYIYPYTYADFAAQTVVINSDSHTDSPVRLTIYGAAARPSWRHYVNGVLFSTGRVNANIAEGRKLVVDNTQIPFCIEQLDDQGGLVSDLYQESDFSTQRFISLQHGVNTITVSSEAVGELRLEVETELQYASI